MTSEEKRTTILKYNSQPFNKQTINDGSYIKINSNNESCIDNINLYIKIENDIIKDFYFDGEACAITISATSIMIKSLLGKSIKEVLEFIASYENMINKLPYNKELLGEAECYDEIYKQPSRKRCALLPYIGLKKAIKEYQESLI
ncbi:MAG TPA: SUF system NifU family Fe-S cluster assembly protein [Bacilli bacterium]|nr:SUF system NifU family Fe-S cluster assembly protein [Bacilli bacterium]